MKADNTMMVPLATNMPGSLIPMSAHKNDEILS